MKNKYVKPEIKAHTIEMEQGICAGSSIKHERRLPYGFETCKGCEIRKREKGSLKCASCNHVLEYN